MTGKSSEGADGVVWEERRSERPWGPSRLKLVVFMRSLDLIPIGQRARRVTDCRPPLPLAEVSPKLLFFGMLSFCVAAPPLGSRGKMQGTRE